MRPRRHLPPWRRLVLEFLAIVLVYIAVLFATGQALYAFIAMIGSMFLLRATRPKVS